MAKKEGFVASRTDDLNTLMKSKYNMKTFTHAPLPDNIRYQRCSQKLSTRIDSM